MLGGTLAQFEDEKSLTFAEEGESPFNLWAQSPASVAERLWPGTDERAATSAVVGRAVYARCFVNLGVVP